jgi:hypothetical protein
MQGTPVAAAAGSIFVQVDADAGVAGWLGAAAEFEQAASVRRCLLIQANVHSSRSETQ